METFTAPKELVQNSRYKEQRQRILVGLNDGMLDALIIDVIHAFNKLP